jgi:hypothetical protein
MRTLCLLTLLAFWSAPAHAETPEELVKGSGVTGGLVVQVGCDDPAETMHIVLLVGEP